MMIMMMIMMMMMMTMMMMNKMMMMMIKMMIIKSLVADRWTNTMMIIKITNMMVGYMKNLEDNDEDNDDDTTAAPLGRTQRLVQTRTPRQDFFKMFTCVDAFYIQTIYSRFIHHCHRHRCHHRHRHHRHHHHAHIMVVGVPHRPTRGMSLCLLTAEDIQHCFLVHFICTF